MIDLVFNFLMYFGGFVIGLIVGLVRRHGIWWTVADTVAAGLLGILVPFLWVGISSLPPVLDTIQTTVSRYPVIGDILGGVLFFSPVVGAFLGLWLVGLVRRRSGEELPPAR